MSIVDECYAFKATEASYVDGLLTFLGWDS